MKKIIEITDNQQTVELTESGEYVVKLIKPDVAVRIVGRFSVKNSEQLGIDLLIHHQAPHTRATVSLKGVAKDQAQLNFKGKIMIDEHCFDTSSFLEERILLLSDQAKAEAIPELEIKCDDVHCSHAATISQIPEEQIFYLMSRGIEHQQAQDLVVDGFLQT